MRYSEISGVDHYPTATVKEIDIWQALKITSANELLGSFCYLFLCDPPILSSDSKKKRVLMISTRFC